MDALTPISTDDFNQGCAKVIEKFGPNADESLAECETLARRAQHNPELLDGYAEHAHRGEYHMIRTEKCAIKAFTFHEGLDRESVVHDHAGFSAVYLVYNGEMNMAFYEEIEPGKKPWPGLRRLHQIKMKAGDTIRIKPDELHTVWSTVPGSRTIAIYDGDLNSTERRIYDINNEVFIRDRSQWDARKKAGAYSGDGGGKLRKLRPDEIVDEA